MSSSSQGSSHDDFDALGDVFMWEGKAFSNIISYTASTKSFTQAESIASSLSSLSSGGMDYSNGRTSASENF